VRPACVDVCTKYYVLPIFQIVSCFLLFRYNIAFVVYLDIHNV
jgi:hypothetical protein